MHGRGREAQLMASPANEEERYEMSNTHTRCRITAATVRYLIGRAKKGKKQQKSDRATVGRQREKPKASYCLLRPPACCPSVRLRQFSLFTRCTYCVADVYCSVRPTVRSRPAKKYASREGRPLRSVGRRQTRFSESTIQSVGLSVSAGGCVM